MAPRDTKAEAFRAGQENPYIGDIAPLQRLYGTIGAIGEELGGSDMGTPVGTKFKERQSATKAEIKRLQELRAKHPEEFGRGQMLAQNEADPYELGLGLGGVGGMAPYSRTTFSMLGGEGSPQGIFRAPAGGFYGSEAFPTDVASLYAARPGRSAFTQTAGREAGAAGGPRALGGAGTPALNYEVVPEAAGPAGSFDQNMMAAYRRGAAGSRAPGRPQAFRPEDFLAIEQGPYPTSRNAYEGNMVQAQRRGMPSPAPAFYDYEGPAGPGPIIDRPVSGYDRNMLDWARGQRQVPGRTGTFREGDFPPYTPEEMGQAVAPYRPQTMVEGGMLPPGGLPARAGYDVPSYRYVGSEADRFPRGEYQAPSGAYGEFRDVTGNVLRGPQGQGAIGYDPGATMGYRMGANAYKYSPQAAGRGIPNWAYPAAGAATLPFYAQHYANLPQQGDVRGAIGTQGQGMMYDFGIPPGAEGMDTIDRFRNYGPEMPTQGAMTAPRGAAPRGPAKKQKAAGVPTPPTKPQELQQTQPQWEGNFNYDVTHMIDQLVGGNQAQKGREYQEYYANNPWPY